LRVPHWDGLDRVANVWLDPCRLGPHHRDARLGNGDGGDPLMDLGALHRIHGIGKIL
jgi:hypothetical protein